MQSLNGYSYPELYEITGNQYMTGKIFIVNNATGEKVNTNITVESVARSANPESFLKDSMEKFIKKL